MMLDPDPKKRPTAREALKNPWFSSDQGVLTDLLVVNESICNNTFKMIGDISDNSFSSFRMVTNYFKKS